MQILTTTLHLHYVYNLFRDDVAIIPNSNPLTGASSLLPAEQIPNSTGTSEPSILFCFHVYYILARLLHRNNSRPKAAFSRLWSTARTLTEYCFHILREVRCFSHKPFIECMTTVGSSLPVALDV